MKKLLVCIFILTATFFAISCAKSVSSKFSELNLVTLYDAGNDSLELKEKTQTWHKSNDCVVVVFGYGYNDSEFVQKEEQKLFTQYGNFYEGGRLLSLVFPDNFKRGTRTYITELANILSDKEVSALVILGAPDGTYAAIAKIQDSYDGKIPFPIISLFSQDDVLGMEYSADFVLDKTQKAQLNGIVVPESEQEFAEEVPFILEKALHYSDISDAPFEKDAKLFDIVKMITGSAKVMRYSDPETGLISINHFVLE